jgi:hypothetical protein
MIRAAHRHYMPVSALLCLILLLFSSRATVQRKHPNSLDPSTTFTFPFSRKKQEKHIEAQSLSHTNCSLCGKLVDIEYKQ